MNFDGALGLAGLILAIVAFFVEVRDDNKIKTSASKVVLIIVAVLLFSIEFMPPAINSEHEPAPDAPTNSVEPDDSGNSNDNNQGETFGTDQPEDPNEDSGEDAENSPEDESSDLEQLHPEDATGTEDQEPVGPTDDSEGIGPVPPESPLNGLLSVVCRDDPSFTDYYILLSEADSTDAMRYSYRELPIELPAAGGNFYIQIKQISTNRVLFDTWQYLDGYTNWEIAFDAPPSTFSLVVNCTDDPGYEDYYVELFTPEYNYIGRFYPSDFPVELIQEPGQYHFSVYQRSTDVPFLDNMPFYAPEDCNYPFYIEFAAPIFPIEHNVFFDIENFSGGGSCSHSSAVAGEIVSYSFTPNREFSTYVLMCSGDFPVEPVTIWNEYEYGLQTFFFYMPDCDVVITVEDY